MKTKLLPIVIFIANGMMLFSCGHKEDNIPQIPSFMEGKIDGNMRRKEFQINAEYKTSAHEINCAFSDDNYQYESWILFIRNVNIDTWVLPATLPNSSSSLDTIPAAAYFFYDAGKQGSQSYRTNDTIGAFKVQVTSIANDILEGTFEGVLTNGWFFNNEKRMITEGKFSVKLERK